MKTYVIVLMVFSISAVACSSSDGDSDNIVPINNSEAALWSEQTLDGAEIKEPQLLTSEDLNNVGDDSASVSVYRTEEELAEDFPDLDLTIDFSSKMVLVARTESTGGCFTGAEIPRVAETDSVLQIFLRSDYSAPEGSTSGCTADIRFGVNIFYSIDYSEKTIQTVAYTCTDSDCEITEE